MKHSTSACNSCIKIDVFTDFRTHKQREHKDLKTACLSCCWKEIPYTSLVLIFSIFEQPQDNLKLTDTRYSACLRIWSSLFSNVIPTERSMKIQEICKNHFSSAEAPSVSVFYIQNHLSYFLAFSNLPHDKWWYRNHNAKLSLYSNPLPRKATPPPPHPQQTKTPPTTPKDCCCGYAPKHITEIKRLIA